jgi:hypothetical protein
VAQQQPKLRCRSIDSAKRRHGQKNLGQKNKSFNSSICSYFFAPDFFARVLDAKICAPCEEVERC